MRIKKIAAMKGKLTRKEKVDMLDLKFVRENPEVVKQNIKNKFQDAKLPLVDEVIELDAENRAAKQEADTLRANRNKLSKQIGALMGQGKKEDAEEVKKQVNDQSARLAELEEKEAELEEKIKKIMLTIPNIIDKSVPIGRDDSENVEVKRYGEPVVPDRADGQLILPAPGADDRLVLRHPPQKHQHHHHHVLGDGDAVAVGVCQKAVGICKRGRFPAIGVHPGVGAAVPL